MTKWYKPFILSSLLCPPWLASAHTECEKLFTSTDRIERQKQFIEGRDRLIGHFSPEKNAKIIADVIRHSTAASSEKVVNNALWLKDIPEQVILYAQELGLTEERAREVAAEMEGEITLLEKKAICYHFTELEHYGADRLMMLKLYDDVNVTEEDTGEQPIAFGYMTTTTDGRSSRVAHLTYSGDCSNRVCNFRDIDKDQFKGTGIRLVHHPEVVETMVTGLSTVVNGDPVLTDLTSLELTKTGEVFTKPEIYTAIYYYGEEVEVDKKSFDRRMMVDIPWALSKGVNQGRTRILTWDNQTRAHVVIMEDDRDIPFGDIQKVIKLGFKAAIEFIPGADAVIQFAEALGRVVDSKDTKGDDGLVAILEGWQKNDFIDELVLERSFDQQSSQHGTNGHATLRLSNMYEEIEQTAEEVPSENLAVREDSDEKSTNLKDDADEGALADDKDVEGSDVNKVAESNEPPATDQPPAVEENQEESDVNKVAGSNEPPATDQPPAVEENQEESDVNKVAESNEPPATDQPPAVEENQEESDVNKVAESNEPPATDQPPAVEENQEESDVNKVAESNEPPATDQPPAVEENQEESDVNKVAESNEPPATDQPPAVEENQEKSEL